MVATWYDYTALATGYSFANADTTAGAAIGATSALVSNGALEISSDAPSGLSKSLIGLTQTASGTSCVTHMLSAPGKIYSFTVYWKMGTIIPANSPRIAFVGSGAGSTSVCRIYLLSTEQIRFTDQADATLFTTTFSGGFVAGTWYRTDITVEVGTTTSNGRLTGRTCLAGSTTALTNTSYDSGATINLGTADITAFRHGPRSVTAAGADDVRIRAGYEAGVAAFIGDQNPPVVYDKSFNDAVGIDDTPVNQSIGYVVTVADAVGITDARGVGHGRNPADAVGVTDAAARVVAAVRTPADAVGVTDSVTDERAVVPADAVGVTDTAALGRDEETNADTAAVTDAVALVVSSVRNPADAVGVTDSVGVELSTSSSNSKTPADAVPITDAVNLVVSSTRTAADAVGVTDSVSVTLIRERTAADAVGVTDTASAALTFPRAGADAVGVTDAATSTFTFGRAPADAVGVTDSVGIDFVIDAAFAVTPADLVGVVDSILATAGAQRGSSDAVGVVDDVLVEFAQGGLVGPRSRALRGGRAVSYTLTGR